MQMKQDLYLKAPTKKQQLLDWIKLRHFVFTHQIDEWGLQNHHIRSMRDAREFAKAGLIRRLTKEEVILRWGNRKEGVYEWVGKEK